MNDSDLTRRGDLAPSRKRPRQATGAGRLHGAGLGRPVERGSGGPCEVGGGSHELAGPGSPGHGGRRANRRTALATWADPAVPGPWASQPLGGHRAHRDAGRGIGLAGAVSAVDAAAGWLSAFASALHRDARAPVNLTPISGLERRLHHLQGDARLALRAVRESVPKRTRYSMPPFTGAYGWPADITDDDAFRELLKLNGGG